MTYIHVAVAVVYGLASFAFGLQVQHWRYGEQLAIIAAERAAERAAAAEQARAAESTRRKESDDAIRRSAARAQTARRDADSARSELDRLRDDIRAAVPGPGGDACAAADQRASAIGELLAECSAAYQGLARTADGHSNDVKTMIEAWPKQ